MDTAPSHHTPDSSGEPVGAGSPQPAGFEPAHNPAPRPPTPRILLREESFVAVHKPSGLMVHREYRGQREDALVQWLRDDLGQHVNPVHRIDRSTSGIVLFALDSGTSRVLCEQFQQHDVRKTYLAVVRGYTDETGTMDTPMNGKDGGPKREAFTDYSCLATTEIPHPVGPYPSARYSLVRVHPKPGRWHQIRRHFNYISHPVVGDTTHGDVEHNRFYRSHFGLHRLLLTAVSLTCKHPVTGDEMTIRTTLDDDLANLFRQFNWPVDMDTLVGVQERLGGAGSP